MNIGELLCKRLKEEIYNKGYTETQFAGKIGMNQSQLNKLLNGDRTPDINLLERVANGLGLDISYLFLERFGELTEELKSLGVSGIEVAKTIVESGLAIEEVKAAINFINEIKNKRP